MPDGKSKNKGPGPPTLPGGGAQPAGKTSPLDARAETLEARGGKPTLKGAFGRGIAGARGGRWERVVDWWLRKRFSGENVAYQVHIRVYSDASGRGSSVLKLDNIVRDPTTGKLTYFDAKTTPGASEVPQDLAIKDFEKYGGEVRTSGRRQKLGPLPDWLKNKQKLPAGKVIKVLESLPELIRQFKEFIRGTSGRGTSSRGTSDTGKQERIKPASVPPGSPKAKGKPKAPEMKPKVHKEPKKSASQAKSKIARIKMPSKKFTWAKGITVRWGRFIIDMSKAIAIDFLVDWIDERIHSEDVDTIIFQLDAKYELLKPKIKKRIEQQGKEIIELARSNFVYAVVALEIVIVINPITGEEESVYSVSLRDFRIATHGNWKTVKLSGGDALVSKDLPHAVTTAYLHVFSIPLSTKVIGDFEGSWIAGRSYQTVGGQTRAYAVFTISQEGEYLEIEGYPAGLKIDSDLEISKFDIKKGRWLDLNIFYGHPDYYLEIKLGLGDYQRLGGSWHRKSRHDPELDLKHSGSEYWFRPEGKTIQKALRERKFSKKVIQNLFEEEKLKWDWRTRE